MECCWSANYFPKTEENSEFWGLHSEFISISIHPLSVNWYLILIRVNLMHLFVIKVLHSGMSSSVFLTDVLLCTCEITLLRNILVGSLRVLFWASSYSHCIYSFFVKSDILFFRQCTIYSDIIVAIYLPIKNRKTCILYDDREREVEREREKESASGSRTN